jgi:hypothetical protein
LHLPRLRGETRRRSAQFGGSTAQSLADAILLARQFCDCLRDRINYFICFSGIDLAEPAVGYSAKKSSIIM